MLLSIVIYAFLVSYRFSRSKKSQRHEPCGQTNDECMVLNCTRVGRVFVLLETQSRNLKATACSRRCGRYWGYCELHGNKVRLRTVCIPHSRR